MSACKHGGSVRWAPLPVLPRWRLAPRHIPTPSTEKPEILTALSLKNIAFILLTHHSDWVSEELDDGNMYCCAAVFCCLNCVRKSPRAWTAIISAPIAAALSAFKRHLLWPQILPKAEFMCLCVCVRVYINSNVSMGTISLNHHNENKGLQRVMQCNFMLPIVAQIGFGKWGRNDN